ncbi:hypothetical protein YC2023_113565 [Brassica napus]
MLVFQTMYVSERVKHLCLGNSPSLQISRIQRIRTRTPKRSNAYITNKEVRFQTTTTGRGEEESFLLSCSNPTFFFFFFGFFSHRVITNLVLINTLIFL